MTEALFVFDPQAIDILHYGKVVWLGISATNDGVESLIVRTLGGNVVAIDLDYYVGSTFNKSYQVLRNYGTPLDKRGIYVVRNAISLDRNEFSQSLKSQGIISDPNEVKLTKFYGGGVSIEFRGKRMMMTDLLLKLRIIHGDDITFFNWDSIPSIHLLSADTETLDVNESPFQSDLAQYEWEQGHPEEVRLVGAKAERYGLHKLALARKKIDQSESNEDSSLTYERVGSLDSTLDGNRWF